MTDEIYKETIEAAKAEMEALLNEEAQIESRLAYVKVRNEALRRTIVNLGDLLGEEREPQSVGITDAIRKLLCADEKVAYLPTTIRRGLEKDGFPINEYKNPLAVIHTTLKRLEDQGEIKAKELRSGKTAYSYNPDYIPF